MFFFSWTSTHTQIIYIHLNYIQIENFRLIFSLRIILIIVIQSTLYFRQLYLKKKHINLKKTLFKLHIFTTNSKFKIQNQKNIFKMLTLILIYMLETYEAMKI